VQRRVRVHRRLGGDRFSGRTVKTNADADGPDTAEMPEIVLITILFSHFGSVIFLGLDIGWIPRGFNYFRLRDGSRFINAARLTNWPAGSDRRSRVDMRVVVDIQSHFQPQLHRSGQWTLWS